MVLKKWAVILLLNCAGLLLSCSRTSYLNFLNSGSSQPILKIQFSDLIGTWQSACFYDSQDNVNVRLTLSVTAGNDFLTTINHYASGDTNCSGPLEPSSHAVTGPATLGAEISEGIYEFDTEITGFAIIYNLITSPQPGVIQLGLMDAGHEGISPETRPVQINTQLSLTKQSSLAFLDMVGTWISNCHYNADGAGDYRIMTNIWQNNMNFQTYIEIYDVSDTTCTGPMNSSFTVYGSIELKEDISPGIYSYDSYVTSPGIFTVYNIMSFPYSGAVQYGLGSTPQTRPSVVDPNITFIKQ